MTKYKIQNASFFKRLAALYLSFFIITLASLSITIALRYLEYIKYEYFSLDFILSFISVFLLVSFSDAFLQCFFTANIAKALMGIKILDSKEDKALGWIRAFIRALTSYVSVLFFGLGYIAIAFNKDHAGLHDYLANSRVVEVERSKFAAIITNIIAFISVLIGTLTSFVLIMTLVFVLSHMIKDAEDAKKYPKFSQETFIKSPNPLVLNLSHERLAALTEFHHFVEFIEYSIDPLSSTSSLQEAKLKLLGVGNLDYNYSIILVSKNPLKVKLEKTIIIPRLIFKDSEGKDFAIENHKFLVANKSTIASDLLSSFDYKINGNSVELNLYPEDLKILNNESLEENSKAFLINFLRTTRTKWQKALKFAPANLIENPIPQKELLQNEVQISLNTDSGDIEKITLLEPSKEEAFNKFCEEFLTNLPRARFIPEELKKTNPLNLEIKLVYQEKL